MTILNVTNECGVLWVTLIGIAVFAIGLFFVMVIEGTPGVLLAGLGGCFFGCIIMVVGLIIPNGSLQYEVTLDKDVKMVEFYEQYEVIEQRGDIWVIKEK